MKRYRIRIAEADFERLQELVFSDAPREAGAFALAGIADYGAGADILVRRAVEVPSKHFLVQHEHRLEIESRAINGLIALCEANGLGAVLCHSHPEDMPYSPSDDHGEDRIFRTMRAFVRPNAPTASLLFYPGGVQGRVWLPDQSQPAPLSEVMVVGRSLQRIPPATGFEQEIYDRQVRAFGRAGQSLISRARVAIVGLGGTGSPTAEQLVRLGVSDLVLIDPDWFTDSNITRVYGTFASALRPSRWSWKRIRKRPERKVDLVAQHLCRINPAARIRTVPESVVVQSAAAQLLDRDVIFLCTDEHWGRSVVNEVAYQYMIPVINMGAAIKARDSTIAAATGAVDVLMPNLPCLWCSQFLRANRIAAESMPRSKRRRLEAEGYVEGVDDKAPSVISITTALSGLAVTQFLQIVTDFMGPSGAVSRLRYDILSGTVRRGTAATAPNCVCQRIRGFGDLRPLSTQPDLSFLEA